MSVMCLISGHNYNQIKEEIVLRGWKKERVKIPVSYCGRCGDRKECEWK